MIPIRVVLADDHPVVRAGIRNILNDAPDIEVIGEARNGPEVLHLVDDLAPDVLLLDVEMPGLTGIEVAQQLQQTKAPVHILALSTYDDREYIAALLASGASGYLTKDEAPYMIIKAVQGVARGERGWFSRQVANRMATMKPGEVSDQTELTDHELAILRLIVAGKTNQEIGLALGLSVKTVEKQLQTVFAKLDVSSRVEAAVYAIQESLI